MDVETKKQFFKNVPKFLEIFKAYPSFSLYLQNTYLKEYVHDFHFLLNFIFFNFSSFRNSRFPPQTWALWASHDFDTVHRTNNVAESVNSVVGPIFKEYKSLDTLGI